MGYESDNEIGIIPRFSKDLFIEIEYLRNQHKVGNIFGFFVEFFLWNYYTLEK